MTNYTNEKGINEVLEGVREVKETSLEEVPRKKYEIVTASDISKMSIEEQLKFSQMRMENFRFRLRRPPLRTVKD